jgi:hypothetical protein
MVAEDFDVSLAVNAGEQEDGGGGGGMDGIVAPRLLGSSTMR